MKPDLYHYSTWGSGRRIGRLSEVNAEAGPCDGGDCEGYGWHVLVVEVPKGLDREQAIQWALDGGLTP